jgi:hypothetical protein
VNNYSIYSILKKEKAPFMDIKLPTKDASAFSKIKYSTYKNNLYQIIPLKQENAFEPITQRRLCLYKN